MGYYVKAILGAVLFCGSVAAFNVALLDLLEIGTCASGGPYQIARPCPEGTDTAFLLLMGSIIAGFIGAVLFAIKGRRPWGEQRNAAPRAGAGLLAWTIFFTVTGGVVLYASLTREDYGADAKLGGTIVGVTFLLMGLPPLGYLVWRWIDDRRNPRPDARFQPSQAQPAPSTSQTTVPTSWPRAGGAPPVAPGGGAAQTSGDAELERLERLERLDRLRESGALTEAEFEQQKRRILDD